MIQKTTARQTSTSVAPFRQSQSQEAPECWGSWAGLKHYSLEVIQHPIRARMCGFGDKDRRPLAPAAVAKMVIRRQDNSLVDVDDVDCSFFLVTVDLWSADGNHEMNLVLHPSSSDRYAAAPAHAAAKPPRRRGTSTSAPVPPSRLPGNQASSRSTPTPTHYHPGDKQTSGGASHYENQRYFSSSGNDSSMSFPSPFSASDGPPTWGYPPSQSNAPSPPPPQLDRTTGYPPPVLPSIHSFAPSQSGRDSWQPPSHSNSDSDPFPLRPWNSDDFSPLDSFHGSSALAGSSSDARGHSGSWNGPELRYSQDDAYHSENVDSQPYLSSNSHQYQPSITYSSQGGGSVRAPSPPPQAQPIGAAQSSLQTLPRHTYTRTLVGPLSSNATRLLDEHRKPGIFFLFQDLSVRTEGTFRLRLRLMNVGASPAPEAGALAVHTTTSPVLAQTFTEPFTVYSAKRFPGVPDTTALSIALGNQGQKLPLRNRHGTSKRRRQDDSGSDDDSDGN